MRLVERWLHSYLFCHLLGVRVLCHGSHSRFDDDTKRAIGDFRKVTSLSTRQQRDMAFVLSLGLLALNARPTPSLTPPACLPVVFLTVVFAGEQSFDDKKNYVEDVTDADFYKCIQLNSTLPGASQLQVCMRPCPCPCYSTVRVPNAASVLPCCHRCCSSHSCRCGCRLCLPLPLESVAPVFFI